MSLTEFLLARIAEDEEGYRREERTANPGPWARLLIDCKARRQIVERYEGGQSVDAGTYACKSLALPYADHPDYRDEWRP